MLKNVLEREIKFQLLILSTSACLWPSCLPKHEWSWKSNSFWRRLWQDSWAVNLRKRERWVWPWTAPFCHYWQSPNVSTGHLFASLAIWLARWRPGDLILLCWFYQVGFTGFFFSLFFFFWGGQPGHNHIQLLLWRYLDHTKGNLKNSKLSKCPHGFAIMDLITSKDKY